MVVVKPAFDLRSHLSHPRTEKNSCEPTKCLLMKLCLKNMICMKSYGDISDCISSIYSKNFQIIATLLKG